MTTLFNSETNQSVFRSNTTITSFEEFQYFTGLTSVEDHAFYSCENLKSVIVPKNVTTIGPSAFSGCKYLSVELPEGLTSIDSEGFRNCFYMKDIRLPESLTTIGRSAFGDCFTLKTLYIPKNVNSINFMNGALGNMRGLVSIVVDPENQTYDSRNGCNAIIEKSTKGLRAACRNTIIPESVVSIYGFANHSQLKSIVIPDSVTEVVASAFYGCSQLKSVVAKGTTPPTLGSNAFTNINADCVLTVPKGKISAYRAAGWGDGQEESPAIFKQIVEAAPDGIPGDLNGDGKVDITDVTKLVNVILGRQ